MSVSDIDEAPLPEGELSIRVIAMQYDTHSHGDIFAGWLVSKMDLAAGISAGKTADGRVITITINGMQFLTAVHIGAVVSCYTNITEIGRSSVKIHVEAWITHEKASTRSKATEGEFIFVAIDDSRRTRTISQSS